MNTEEDFLNFVPHLQKNFHDPLNHGLLESSTPLSGMGLNRDAAGPHKMEGAPGLMMPGMSSQGPMKWPSSMTLRKLAGEKPPAQSAGLSEPRSANAANFMHLPKTMSASTGYNSLANPFFQDHMAPRDVSKSMPKPSSQHQPSFGTGMSASRPLNSLTHFNMNHPMSASMVPPYGHAGVPSLLDQQPLPSMGSQATTGDLDHAHRFNQDFMAQPPSTAYDLHSHSSLPYALQHPHLMSAGPNDHDVVVDRSENNLYLEDNSLTPEEIYQLIIDLTMFSKREKALLELSRRREMIPDLALLLWHTFGVITAILQEIISIYSLLSPPNLTHAISNRVCNALALLQTVASHPETRQPFLNAHIPFLLYPFLNTIADSLPFEYLKLTCLGVIGALVKVSVKPAMVFVQTEIIPLCLRIMEMGSDLSKTVLVIPNIKPCYVQVATFVVQKILVNDLGSRYIRATPERFYALSSVLGGMVVSLVKNPSSRLLKHIIKCYMRLADNPKSKEALKHTLPMALRDGSLLQSLEDDPVTRRNLQTLFAMLDFEAPPVLAKSTRLHPSVLAESQQHPAPVFHRSPPFPPTPSMGHLSFGQNPPQHTPNPPTQNGSGETPQESTSSTQQPVVDSASSHIQQLRPKPGVIAGDPQTNATLNYGATDTCAQSTSVQRDLEIGQPTASSSSSSSGSILTEPPARPPSDSESGENNPETSTTTPSAVPAPEPSSETTLQ